MIANPFSKAAILSNWFKKERKQFSCIDINVFSTYIRDITFYQIVEIHDLESNSLPGAAKFKRRSD